jgi:hypothetical protein
MLLTNFVQIFCIHILQVKFAILGLLEKPLIGLGK